MRKILQIMLAAGHILMAGQNVISTVLIPAVNALTTVSYTHLDVYKRQLFSRVEIEIKTYVCRFVIQGAG